ncbi:MAG: efflux RND transporter permease subunit [Rhodothermales bacterium]|nr:efflux RND transporter permease subunit [Rhodothermales bacterium]MBO6779062.1 efflux RND transporter permease subunit [Rhodothermales bacterium]
MNASSLITRLQRRPVGVLAWSTALLLAGAWAATQVPLEWAPTVELPEVTVSATWPGASPRAVERYVTAPIERAAARVAGTERIASYSTENSASVTLGISQETDVGLYVAQLNEQLAVLRETLPDRVWPRLTKRIPESLKDEQGFMELQVIGPRGLDELRQLTERRVKPRIQAIQGIAEIEVRGGTERELLIELDPDRLSTYGLGPQDIERQVRDLFADEAYGRLRGAGSSALLMRTPEQEVDGYRDLVVHVPPGLSAPVYLRDVASVELGPAPVRSISRIDGNPVVSMRLDRAKASNLVAVAESVYDAIEALRSELPDDVRVLVPQDRSEHVRAQLRDLTWRGGLGLILVVFVLLFMLKSVRATGVVLFSVAVSIAVAFLMIGPAGLSLNLLTIAGLVLVFGLLVDNAVVVVEQLMHHRGPNAGERALQTVWLPLVGGTLSTMVVMLPLVYLSGDLQALFLPFGVLVCVVLAASLVSAAVVAPVAGRRLKPLEVRPGRSRRLRRWAAAPYRLVARFPRTTVLAAVLAVGLPVWLLPYQISVVNDPEADPRSPTVRLASLYNETFDRSWVRDLRDWTDPVLGGLSRKFKREVTFGERWRYSPRPSVYVNLGFPPGHPIARADSLMLVFEREALASPSVEKAITHINESSASLRLTFSEQALLEAEPYLLRERLISHAVNTGGLRISVGGLIPDGYFSGVGSGISGIRLDAMGPNYEDLDRLMQAFADYVSGRSRRVAGVELNASRGYGFDQARQVLRFDWTSDSQLRSGVTAGQMARSLSPVFRAQTPVGHVDMGDEVQMGVRLAVKGVDDLDVERLIQQPFPVTDTSAVRLAGLATYVVEERPSAIRREDQRYVRTIQIDFRGPGQMANTFIESALEGFAVPVGYDIQRSSFSFFTDEVQRQFTWLLWATIALVFLITAAVFESWRLPLIVLLSVPTALIGVATGFLWTDAAFAEGAFIGAILMVGIAVNDSILLVDRFRQLREARPGGQASVLMRLAVRERLRPMITTTLTSVVTMLPMVVFPSETDFWLGLAVTVIGGLTASTLFAPLVSVAVVSMGSNKQVQAA